MYSVRHRYRTIIPVLYCYTCIVYSISITGHGTGVNKNRTPRRRPTTHHWLLFGFAFVVVTIMASDDSDWEKEDQEDKRSEEESFHDDDDDSSDSYNNKKPAAGGKTKSKTKTVKQEESTAADAAAAAAGGENNKNGKTDRRKRLRRVDFTAEDDEIDQLPSHQRLTEKGGYMHTKNSRLKISHANKGKSPWNKGKNRSETAKAKISAGVRARNHGILLLKLGKLGMTEDEWFRKKKQIKLLRERVRKAKVAAVKHEETRKTGLLEKSLEKSEALKKELDDLVDEIETDDESNDDPVSRRRILTGSIVSYW
jgi:hypothetical protein